MNARRRHCMHQDPNVCTRSPRRGRWHTCICWRGQVGVILVNGGYSERTLAHRLNVARQLARWAWGGMPHGTENRARDLSAVPARQRGGLHAVPREAG